MFTSRRQIIQSAISRAARTTPATSSMTATRRTSQRSTRPPFTRPSRGWCRRTYRGTSSRSSGRRSAASGPGTSPAGGRARPPRESGPPPTPRARTPAPPQRGARAVPGLAPGGPAAPREPAGDEAELRALDERPGAGDRPHRRILAIAVAVVLRLFRTLPEVAPPLLRSGGELRALADGPAGSAALRRARV